MSLFENVAFSFPENLNRDHITHFHGLSLALIYTTHYTLFYCVNGSQVDIAKCVINCEQFNGCDDCMEYVRWEVINALINYFPSCVMFLSCPLTFEFFKPNVFSPLNSLAF